MPFHKDAVVSDASGERHAPTGWALHCRVRDLGARIKPRRHGNWKHGRRAKETRTGVRELREVIRNFDALMRGRAMPHPETPAPGWLLYPHVRPDEAGGDAVT